ncbi:hypothetical protein ABE527_17790 [Brucella sp. TWI432]
MKTAVQESKSDINSVFSSFRANIAKLNDPYADKLANKLIETIANYKPVKPAALNSKVLKASRLSATQQAAQKRSLKSVSINTDAPCSPENNHLPTQRCSRAATSLGEMRTQVPESNFKRDKIRDSAGSDHGASTVPPSSTNTAAEIVSKLTSIQKDNSGLEARYNQKLISNLLSVYRMARELKADKDTWYRFCRDPLWVGQRSTPKLDEEHDALKFALRLAIGFGTAENKKVSKYHLTLNPLFLRGKNTATVKQKIEEAGSLEALKKSHKPPKPKKEAATTVKLLVSPKFTEAIMRQCISKGNIDCPIRIMESGKSLKIVIHPPYIDDKNQT